MENLKDLFIPYRLALIANEKNFDTQNVLANFCTKKHGVFKEGEIYFGGRHPNKDVNRIIAPLYQQIVDWLKKEHDIFIFMKYDVIYGTPIESGVILSHLKTTEVFGDDEENVGNYYYDTYNKLIEEAFKLIK